MDTVVSVPQDNTAGTPRPSFVKRYKTVLIATGILFVVAAVVVPTTTVLVLRNNDDKSKSVSESLLPKEPIEIPSNFTKDEFTFGVNFRNDSSWNVVKYVYGVENIYIKNNTSIDVVYPAGSYNPSGNGTSRGGFNFYAQPKTINLTNEIYMSYNLMFGNDTTPFNWVKGGMLPGIWIGRMGAFNGKYLEDGSSIRVMWRANGLAEAFVYVPPKQLPSYYQIPGYFNNEGYGESLGRSLMKFKLNEWNKVVIHVKLNTPGMNDGILELNVNEDLLRFEEMYWRDGAEPISGIMMHTFFGGSDTTWATPVGQTIQFSNFAVYM